jgi:hypothetical protein
MNIENFIRFNASTKRPSLYLFPLFKGDAELNSRSVKPLNFTIETLPGFRLNRVDPSWTLIKEIDEDSFSLRLEPSPSDVVEFVPDSAFLVNDEVGAELRVTLDMAEVLLRASEGELFGDDDSLAIRQQAHAYLDRVSQSKGDRATLLSPSGTQFKIQSSDGRIEMVDRK